MQNNNQNVPSNSKMIINANNTSNNFNIRNIPYNNNVDGQHLNHSNNRNQMKSTKIHNNQYQSYTNTNQKDIVNSNTYYASSTTQNPSYSDNIPLEIAIVNEQKDDSNNSIDINIEDINIEDINIDYYITDTINLQNHQKDAPQTRLDDVSKITEYVISNTPSTANTPSNTAFLFDTNDVGLIKKSKKRKTKRKKSRKHSKSDGIGYDPHQIHRAQGNIQISKTLTENIIPLRIKENIKNMYQYMDKSYALSMDEIYENKQNDGMIKILNYDFNDKESNERLYCIIQRQDMLTNKARGYKWKMINKLFTNKEIENEYGISTDKLPKSWRETDRFRGELLMGNEIKMLLMDTKQRQNIIDSWQWHKVDIFHKTNNKRRMTLSLTKPEFIRECTHYANNVNDINLIPILMYNADSYDYWIEYVWIIQIDINNISIGISFKYNKQNGIKVTGIHLDKNYLLIQHQLVLPQHDCHCLDHFKSSINYLKIGNPDDLQNKINYYRQVIEELSQYKENMKCFMNIEPNNLHQFQVLQKRFGQIINFTASPTIGNNKYSPSSDIITPHGAAVTVNNNNSQLSLPAVSTSYPQHVQSPRYRGFDTMNMNQNNNYNQNQMISPSYTINSNQYFK